MQHAIIACRASDRRACRLELSVRIGTRSDIASICNKSQKRHPYEPRFVDCAVPCCRVGNQTRKAARVFRPTTAA